MVARVWVVADVVAVVVVVVIVAVIVVAVRDHYNVSGSSSSSR